MTAFHKHAGRAKAAKRQGRAFHFIDRCRGRRVEQHARFRQVGRKDRSERQQAVAQGADRVVAQERVAGFRDHDRIDDDAARLPAFESVRHDRDELGELSMPILTAVIAMSP